MAGGQSVVTGGLGYIGQAIAAELKARGEDPIIIDRRPIPAQIDEVRIIRGDIRDGSVWDQVTAPRAIFHCAGLIQVGESVEKPARYFDDNVSAGLSMLSHVLERFGPIPIIFSSSAAVYGVPDRTPIDEGATLHPLSPYGVTKRQFEEILAAFQAAYGIPYVALRYFNAAGTDGRVKENHDPETHLLPRVARALVAGEAPVIYGSDYPTPDGTAIRDYIHVQDLVEAHVAARQYLEDGGASTALNLGSGRGMSVLEMVEAFRDWLPDMPAPRRVARRPGDPPVLVAAIERARSVLHWSPSRSDAGRLVGEAFQTAVSR